MGGVIVLGAGLSGLGCATQLPECQVFEAASHLGGHAYSHPQAGVGFDQGAHICHSKDPHWLKIITEAAVDVAEIDKSVVRNHRNGRWLTYPVQNHLHELPAEERLKALTDLITAHVEGGDPADYRAWCQRQYGRYLAETFYEVFTVKYWRTPPEQLATDWLAGRLLPSQLPRIIQGAFGPEAESQAVFARFRYPAHGGFYSFFAPLYAGLDITLNEPAAAIDAANHVVRFRSGRRETYDYLASSLALPDLIHMIHDAPKALKEKAARLRCTQLLCVNMIVNRQRLTDCHWFYIYDPDLTASRVSIPSNLSPRCLPPGQTAIQAEVFRRDDETFDLANLVEHTAQQMADLLNFDRNEIAHLGHTHVKRAYIISNHERAALVTELLGWLAEHNILSMGLYGAWKYVWSDEAYRQGRRAAETILARMNRRLAG